MFREIHNSKVRNRACEIVNPRAREPATLGARIEAAGDQLGGMTLISNERGILARFMCVCRSFFPDPQFHTSDNLPLPSCKTLTRPTLRNSIAKYDFAISFPRFGETTRATKIVDQTPSSPPARRMFSTLKRFSHAVARDHCSPQILYSRFGPDHSPTWTASIFAIRIDRMGVLVDREVKGCGLTKEKAQME